MGAQFGDLRNPLDKLIALQKETNRLLGCSTCRTNTTSAGVNVDVPAGFKSVTITKTNGTGTVVITLSDNSTYTLTANGESFTDTLNNGVLPLYDVATSDGATWKWHGVK